MPECTLCDLPTPDLPHTAEDLPGVYCCPGCLAVARAVPDPETADVAGPVGEGAAAAEGVGAPTDEGVGAATDAGSAGETVYLPVEGMHCATCESFLESRVSGVEGVHAVDASYPAGLLRLSVDPDRADDAAIRRRIDGLGYRVAEAADGIDAGADHALGASAGTGTGESAGTRCHIPTASGGDGTVARLLVGGFFGMMTMLWYVLFLYPAYLGIDPALRLMDVEGPAGQYLLWNVWLMATVVLGYTGKSILRRAAVSVLARRPNMDLLVALAAGTAYVYSLLTLALGGTEVYFDVSIVIVLAVTLGTHYEGRMRERAAGKLADLAAERVETARRRTGGGTESVGVKAVEPGDALVVKPGERVPLDGTVATGRGAVDEALLTGESLPRAVEPGDEVPGGATLVDGGLAVTVAEGATSTLERLVGLLWDVQSSRAGAQHLADRLAAVFVPAVLVLAGAGTAWSLAAGTPLAGAVLTGLAVLVVSCPCALGLATPLAVAAGVRAAIDRGVVITDGSVFETAPTVDTVVLDKTGTLSTGEMAVEAVYGDPATLPRAAALEAYADHPVAHAICRAAEGDSMAEAAGSESRSAATSVETVPGRGVEGVVAGHETLVGGLDRFDSRNWTVPDDLAVAAQEAEADGALPVVVGWDGEARGVIVARDAPRPEWQQAVSALAVERRVVVLTGDDERAARRYESHPGVDEVLAGVPPDGKVAAVERLRREGIVAMVGDGVNDAPALAAADVGIAIERGAGLPTDAADAVVTSGDLRTVPAVFDLFGVTRRRIRGNLGWAFLYNAIAIPVALTGALNPLVAAVAMSASSLLVVGNSARGFGVVDPRTGSSTPSPWAFEGDQSRPARESNGAREPSVDGERRQGERVQSGSTSDP